MKRKQTNQPETEDTLSELQERMKQMLEKEKAFAESCPDSKTYLEEVRKRHGNEPCFMVYEVVEMVHMTVIFTSENWTEALRVFTETLKHDNKARMDVVVRDVETGKPHFRQTVQELQFVNRTEQGASYSDPYGRFGPSVYNHIFRDAKWAGYESYTKPTKTFNFQWEP
jgi:transcription elongation factor GreA-like protein